MKWNSNKNAQADGGDRTGEKARTVGKIRGGRHTAEIGKSLASIGLALLIGALFIRELWAHRSPWPIQSARAFLWPLQAWPWPWVPGAVC